MSDLMTEVMERRRKRRLLRDRMEVYTMLAVDSGLMSIIGTILWIDQIRAAGQASLLFAVTFFALVMMSGWFASKAAEKHGDLLDELTSQADRAAYHP